MEKSNMEYTARGSSAARSYDQSLGILNMDNMSAFGEFSSGGGNSSSRVSDRLHRARLMALETLQKAQEQDEKFSRRSMDQSNKENTAANSESNAINSFVPFRQRNTINISDLVLEESINLENSERPCPPTGGKDMKISFEPAEITGRSTLHQRDFNVPSQQLPAQQQRHKPRGRDSSLMSVDEILASSFAPKARNLCETLRAGDISISDTTMPPEPRSRDVANASSSLLSSYNMSHSLPHTADMSAAFAKASSTKGSYASFRDADGFNFADEIASKAVSMMDAVAGDDEDFAPGELMKSKLLMDEISWAQEYAAIPEAALSEDARALAQAAGPVVDKNSTQFETTSATNSMIAGDPNFSLGNYFQMRSEDIWQLAKGPQSPDKCRTPIALVDSECEDNTVSTTSGFATPQLENKTYKKPDGNTVTICQGKKAAPSAKDSNRDSKDSGMDTDSSYLLTISAIDRALCNLQVETDCSSGDLIDEIKRHAKKNPKTSAGGSAGMPTTPSRMSGSSGKAAERMSAEFLAALIAENKENLDPHKLKSPSGAAAEDTMSFTESLLNSSTMKRLTANDGSPPQPRSPLSPISLPQEAKADESSLGAAHRLTVPQLKLNSAAVDDGGHDPDVDEWPSSPVVTPNRVRRHKSPSERMKHRTAPLEAALPVTPVSSTEAAAARRKAYSHTQPPRSLCSTRLESAKGADVASDFVISPNMSKSSIHMRNATLTPTSGAAAAANYGDGSPFSSPRSYLSASGASSPHLDSTTNSERRQLAASGSGLLDGKSPVSSPVGGDSSGGRHGGAGAPSRSCSCNSMKSSMSTATTTTTGSRSLSRCSNSSEFSHRDGKVIPLKVTMLELSWSSTKLRTDSRKSMQVKNTAHKRLIVRVQVHGPGYQILSHHGGPGHNPASTMLTLQSQECRSIVINFCPTVTGVAIGSLAFYAPNSQTSAGGSTNNSGSSGPFLEIPLYGYGGHASVVPRNILKGPVGDAFLPIGDLYELTSTPELERNFEIFNKGPLPGFAVVSVNSSGVNMPRLHDAFVVHPDRVLIPPGGAAVVRVSFRPKRDDMKKIMKKISHVLTLASMRVLCGDEANRQRMRQLVGRMAPNELAKITSAHSLESLWQQFPGEVPLDELEPLGREKTDVTFDLLTSVRVHEISLTLNHDALDDTAAETTSLIFPDADETVLFRTVCASNDESPVPPYTERGHHQQHQHHYHGEQQQRSLETVTEMFERSSISSPRPRHVGQDGGRPEVSSSSAHGSWSVSPQHLEFDFNSSGKCTECCTLYVRNDYASRLYFEVMCNYKGVVRCMPDKGYVEGAGREVAIQVETVLEKRLVAVPAEPMQIIVKLDEERITVPIRVPRLEGRKP